MIKHIDHIAFKVGDLAGICDSFQSIGLVCDEIKTFAEVGMNIAFIKKSQTSIELLEVIDQTSPIANDPEGFSHIGLKVQNIEETFAMMQGDSRFTPIGTIRQGAHSRIFFFRMKGQENVLFECVE
jgi:hypothetical protein